MSASEPRLPLVEKKPPLIIELEDSREKIQCECPSTELRELGWKGYRERRSQLNGLSPKTCMRRAQWIVGDARLCTQHAGMRVLNMLKEE